MTPRFAWRQGPPRSRLSPRDLVGEATSGVTRRAGRSALTALGTLLGVGAFVGTLGLASSASAQISGRFDALKATEVVVQDSQPSQSQPAFPKDVETPLRRLNGVLAAGILWPVETANDPVQRRPGRPDGNDDAVLPVMAASPGALEAIGARITSGRAYDRFHSGRGEQVALLGAAAAERLGVVRVDPPRAFYISGRAFTVLGIVGDVQRRPELLLSVIVPDRTAERTWDGQHTASKTVVIHTRLGAAQLIGRQAPLALRPHDAERLITLVPPDPRTLRRDVEGDVDVLLLLMAGVSVVIGAIGIANTTLVSVLERVEEIGLRRALGAARCHIAAQFLAESAMLGTVGGFVGACSGVIVVGVVCTVRGWGAVIDPMVVLPAPLIGTATGLLAGLYPAIKAASFQPVRALNR